MPITLKNLTGTPQTFNLVHDSLRAAGGDYGYKVHSLGRASRNPQTGEKTPRLERKALPASITFLAGETKKDLPNVIKLCPEVASALTGRNKLLRLVDETPDAPPAGGAKVVSIAPDKSVLTPAGPAAPV